MKRKESVVGGYLRKQSINYNTYLHGKGEMYSIMLSWVNKARR